MSLERAFQGETVLKQGQRHKSRLRKTGEEEMNQKGNGEMGQIVENTKTHVWNEELMVSFRVQRPRVF